jgi:hypothetical protein
MWGFFGMGNRSLVLFFGEKFRKWDTGKTDISGQLSRKLGKFFTIQFHRESIPRV